ncbi:hypothetical protein GCM10008956_33260 [Deinococcus arenae]|uniref:Uncharacterized protein n=1 Tax=Deinococcus arenae TaxID=1452751 RepID=A0A8H9GWE3_9DEIO|nr:hypothetical protein GCM10008956_33260 [Deinococcus arenae]
MRPPCTPHLPATRRAAPACAEEPAEAARHPPNLHTLPEVRSSIIRAGISPATRTLPPSLTRHCMTTTTGAPVHTQARTASGPVNPLRALPPNLTNPGGQLRPQYSPVT